MQQMADDTGLHIRHAANTDTPSSGAYFTFNDITENVEAEWSKTTKYSFDKPTQKVTKTKTEFSDTIISMNGFSREQNGFMDVKRGLQQISKWLNDQQNYSSIPLTIPNNDRVIQDRAAWDAPEFLNQKGFDFRIWHNEDQVNTDADYANKISIAWAENSRSKSGSFVVQK